MSFFIKNNYFHHLKSFLFTSLVISPIPGECNDAFRDKLAAQRFIASGDGIVKDRLTGLLWQRCSLGQVWDGKQCREEFKRQVRSWFSWEDAQRYLLPHQALTQEAWRLPTLRELKMLVDKRSGTPAINRDMFPGTPGRRFWTADAFRQNSEYAWVVDFKDGTTGSELKSTPSYHVRLVKGKVWQDAVISKDVVGNKSFWDDGIHDLTNPALNALQAFSDAVKLLPRDDRGEVDWVKALQDQLIAPRAERITQGEMQTWEHDIIYKDTKGMAFVRFPHKAHSEWLACKNCHTDIFEMKAYSADIDMASIYSGKACGACHGRVAFSPNNCERCHSVLHDKAQDKWWSDRD